MYTIQRHKATNYILDILKTTNILGAPKYRDIRIAYQNDIPLIRYKDNLQCYDYDLEYLCCSSMKEGQSLTSYIVSRVLKIYNPLNWDIMHSSIVCHDFSFTLLSDYKALTFITILGKRGLLFFLIDPLRAIAKMDHNNDRGSAHYFFECFGGIIIKQDRESLLKYLLINQLVNNFMVDDIVRTIIDIVINLLLL